MNDDILLSQLKRQEPEALEELMKRHSGLVYKIIYNMLGSSGSASDAEELVSDTFYAVWNHAENIGTGKLKAYLSITARNKAKTFLRSRREMPMDLDELEIADSFNSPEEAAMNRELQKTLQKALCKMRPRDKEIFLLYYYYLQPTPEIARSLGMPVSSVRTRLARGRKLLKKHLDKEALF